MEYTMEDLVEHLQDYLLISKCAGRNDKEITRESLKTIFEDLVNRLLNEDMWNLFLNDQYEVTILKATLNSKSDQERSDIFKFGMACLIVFTQENFTGPTLSEKITNFLTKDIFQAHDFRKMLSYNNEDINCQTHYPQLLVTAKIIFEWCIVNSIVNIWWYWRALYLHQQILDELSPSLLSDADRLYKLLQSNFAFTGFVKTAIDLEIAQLYLLFRHAKKAKFHIKSAAGLEDLNQNVNEIGKQFVSTDNVNNNNSADGKLGQYNNPYLDFGTILTTDNAVLPSNLCTDYEKKKKICMRKKIVPESNLKQKVLLTLVLEKFVSKPNVDSENDEQVPYLDTVLEYPNTFCVRTVALLLRIKEDLNNKRNLNAAIKQCKEIINFKKEQPALFDRFPEVFCCGLPPTWKVTTQLADLFLGNGNPTEALNIYLKLEFWEEAVGCCTVLKLKHKAAEIIKQQLKIKPTVKLLCLLGDATDNVSWYEKAWDYSKRRSHRVQRHWGTFLYKRKQYEECIPHFEKSLSINPLQTDIWFKMGVAACKANKWQVAATAYKRYTTMKPDCVEAWTQLAEAYLNIHNKRGAHQAMMETLRCNSENWKAWQNFLVISSEISMHSDVIRAYNRLLDIKERYFNRLVLEFLVGEITEDTVDCEGLPASRFLQKARALLGRLISIYPSEKLLWELSARLSPTPLLKVQRYLRSIKLGTEDDQWFKDELQRNNSIETCLQLSEAVLSEIDWKSLVIETVITTLNAALIDVKKSDNTNDISKAVDQLEDNVKQITEKLASQKNTSQKQHNGTRN